MMELLRRAASGFIAKILIALLVLSFAVWGISDVFTGIGQRHVLSVGSAKISAETFQLALNREMRRLTEQTGQFISLEQARAIGLDQQVLGRLSVDAALDDQAQKFGLGISDSELAKRIADDPSFQVLGGFNRDFFTQILASYGLTEQDFIKDARAFALRQQLGSAIAGEMNIPDVMMQIAHRFDNETRAGQLIRLTPSRIESINEPEDDVLKAFFDKNKQRYREPERRTFSMINLSATSILSLEDITDEEIQEEYEANKEAYQNAEKRSASQLLFQKKEQAEKAKLAFEQGKTFKDIAEDEAFSASLTTLPLNTHANYIDENVANALFAMANNLTVSDVIENRFGFVLIKLETVEKEKVQPLEEVKEELRQAAAERKAEEDLFALYDAIEDARAGGATLKEVATRQNLSLLHFEKINAQGFNTQNERENIPNQQEVITAVFEGDVGVEASPIEGENNTTQWIEVEEVSASRQKEPSEVREDVVQSWKTSQIKEKLSSEARTFMERLQKGQTIESIAAENDLQLETVRDITRAQAPENIPDELVDALFNAPVKSYQDFALEEKNEHIVLYIADSTVPAMFENDENVLGLKERLSSSMQDTLLSQYVQAIQDDLGVVINQPLLQILNGANQAHQNAGY